MKQLLLLSTYLISQITLSQSVKVFDERKLSLKLDNYILVENHLTIDSEDSSHWLLTGMFVEAANTGNYGVFATTTQDAGKSWSTPIIFDEPEGADPWGIIGPDGIQIVSVLGLENIRLYHSADKGATWNQGDTLKRGFDHQTMIYDAERGFIYLTAIKGNSIYWNYSTDSGFHFRHPKEWKYNNLGTNTMNAQLNTDGTLLIPFSNFNRPAINGSRAKGKIELLDKSLNYFLPVKIDEPVLYPRFICESCEKGFPVMAVDMSNSKYEGNMYYVCSNQTDGSILFHRSNTKGESWSSPIPISSYYAKEKDVRNPFTGIPQIAINNKGIVGVIWQDRSNDPDGLCNRLYFSASLDGGQTFIAPTPVSSAVSCMERQENDWAGSRYKSGGDYTGFITDSKGNFIAIWPDSRNGIAQLYMARIQVSNE